MLSLVGSLRIWLLLLGIAVVGALAATVSVTYYPDRSVAVSSGDLSSWSRIIRIGDVRDPIDIDALWPADTASSLEELSKRLPTEQWAAVEAIAVKSVTGSPLNPRMWLVLAIARAAQHAAPANVGAALKMSYDTGPYEATILVPRLLLSVELDFSSDPELTAAIRQELRHAFSEPQRPRHTLVEARCRAVPQARKLIDNVARDLGPVSDAPWGETC
jgi:hypothetical protein